MSQNFHFFFSRNLLDLDFVLDFRHAACNTLLIILQMLVTLPLMPFKFCRCFIEQTSSLVFQRVACDTIHLIQQCNLMRRPGLLCLIFERTHSFPLLQSRNFGSLCKCNMNYITSCSLKFLSCSFEACLLEVQSVSVLLLPANTLLCQYIPKIVSGCFHCDVPCASPW